MLDEITEEISKVRGKVTEVIVNSDIWTDELSGLAGQFKVSQMCLGPFVKCMIKYLPDGESKTHTYVVNMNACRKIS